MARGVGTALHSGDERLLAHRPSSSKAKTGTRVRMDSRVAVPRQHVGRTVMSHELPTAGGRNASQPTGSTTRGSVFEAVPRRAGDFRNRQLCAGGACAPRSACNVSIPEWVEVVSRRNCPIGASEVGYSPQRCTRT